MKLRGAAAGGRVHEVREGPHALVAAARAAGAPPRARTREHRGGRSGRDRVASDRRGGVV